jgi:hypothetical protein
VHLHGEVVIEALVGVELPKLAARPVAGRFLQLHRYWTFAVISYSHECGAFLHLAAVEGVGGGLGGRTLVESNLAAREGGVELDGGVVLG